MKTAFDEYNSIVSSIPDNIRKEVDMEMAVSNRIYDLMTQKGLSKAEFARSLGKRPCEITKWLSGQHNFTLSTLAMLSSFFGQPIITVGWNLHLYSNWKKKNACSASDKYIWLYTLLLSGINFPFSDNLVILQCLRRSRREFLQPSNRFGFSYELDNSNCSRLLRGRLYLLPRKGKIRWRSRMVGLDLRIPCVYNYKYGIVGKSHTKPTDRDCICRMDWYWSSRNSFSWHPLFPRTPNLLAFVFHLYADIVNYRT